MRTGLQCILTSYLSTEVRLGSLVYLEQHVVRRQIPMHDVARVHMAHTARYVYG